jgi:hypothetical protein
MKAKTEVGRRRRRRRKGWRRRHGIFLRILGGYSIVLMCDAWCRATYKYQPPDNFTPLSSDSLSNSNPFSTVNLNGKELWFITTPVGAPLTKIRTINATDVKEGNPVLETKSGRGYCLKPDWDAEEEGVVIMVPNSEGVYREGIRTSPRVLEDGVLT